MLAMIMMGCCWSWWMVPTAAAGVQDIAAASAGELVAYLHDKGAFPLLRAFLDCGMTYGAGENSVKGGLSRVVLGVA
jgi:hypothetical protein